MEFKTITAIEATQPAQEAALFWRGFGTSYENKELGLNVEEVVGVVRELRTGGRSWPRGFAKTQPRPTVRMR